MKHRPLLFLVLPMLLLAVALFGVRSWSGSGDVASADVGTGTMHLEIDMVQDTGWCDTIDTSASHAEGAGSYQVAVCLSDANPLNNEVPKAFQFNLEYNDTLNRCLPVDCDTDAETEGIQGTCRDSNPDANDGTPAFSTPDLGSGWNCNASDVDPPLCDKDPLTGAGHGVAYLSCFSTNAGTLPVSTTTSEPIAVVTFQVLAGGTDNLKLNLVAMYGAAGGFLFCDPPPAAPGPCKGATDNKTGGAVATPTNTATATATPSCGGTEQPACPTSTPTSRAQTKTPTPAATSTPGVTEPTTAPPPPPPPPPSGGQQPVVTPPSTGTGSVGIAWTQLLMLALSGGAAFSLILGGGLYLRRAGNR